MSHSKAHPDRLDELLAERALCPLDATEEQELDELLDGETPSDRFESLVGSLFVAFERQAATPAPEILPAALRDEVSHRARTELGGGPGAPPSPQDGPLRFPNMAWVIAAACIVFAVAGWSIAILSPGQPSPAQLYSSLNASSEIIRAKWQAPQGTKLETCGDLLWDAEKQRGVMRFEGLSPNDPNVEQYQLWIFDEGQLEATPIDGGVFDVSDQGDALIAIDAKLRVTKPTFFAVTLEKPGGVVVSDRERIVLTATPIIKGS